jgi:AbrB family looped-hinge helix DNA binding protein
MMELLVGTQAKVTSKGQITLPASLRAEYGIEAGDLIVFFKDLDDRPTFVVRRMRRGAIRPVKAWKAPSRTDKDLDEGIARAVRQDFLRAERDSGPEGDDA